MLATSLTGYAGTEYGMSIKNDSDETLSMNVIKKENFVVHTSGDITPDSVGYISFEYDVPHRGATAHALAQITSNNDLVAEFKVDTVSVGSTGDYYAILDLASQGKGQIIEITTDDDGQEHSAQTTSISTSKDHTLLLGYKKSYGYDYPLAFFYNKGNASPIDIHINNKTDENLHLGEIDHSCWDAEELNGSNEVISNASKTFHTVKTCNTGRYLVVRADEDSSTFRIDYDSDDKTGEITTYYSNGVEYSKKQFSERDFPLNIDFIYARKDGFLHKLFKV